MTPHMKWGIAALIVGLILFIWNPIAAVIVIALAIAVPVTLYRMLSPEQRRRLRQQRGRKQIGG
jgi:membrane protein implicated in regulation of membrane protease activity